MERVGMENKRISVQVNRIFIIYFKKNLYRMILRKLPAFKHQFKNQKFYEDENDLTICKGIFDLAAGVS